MQEGIHSISALFSDSDSLNHDSDTSAGVTDLQATFMRNGSQATSTDCLGGSADILGKEESTASSTSRTQTIELRMNRRTTNRPWSVSCISQLEGVTSKALLTSSNQDSNFSISESALDTLSLPNLCNKSDQSSPAHKRTLRKRRLRNQRRSSRKEHKIDPRLMREMVKSESFSGQFDFKDDILAVRIEASPSKETDEESMCKPDFKIGSVTKVYAQTLGPLAGLANFNQKILGKDEVSPSPMDFQRSGAEEMSSMEQAWDNYQEKYLSEPYSEDRDMDAAKRLLEFGDDYRAFLDSQSDACSSLSAAHLDSVSPPRPRRFVEGTRTPSDVADSSLELRKRRLWELSEFERRRKNKIDGEGKMICEPQEHPKIFIFFRSSRCHRGR